MPGILGSLTPEIDAYNQARAIPQQEQARQLGMLAQLQAMQEQAQTGPLRRGLLEAQVAKAQQEAAIQGELGQVNLQTASPESLRAIAVNLARRNHPGAATFATLADRAEQRTTLANARNEFQAEAQKPTDDQALSQFGYRKGPTGMLERLQGTPDLSASEDQAGFQPLSVPAQNPTRLAALAADAKIPGSILGQLIPKPAPTPAGFTHATRYDAAGNPIATAAPAPLRMAGRNQPGSAETPGDFTKTGDEFLQSLPQSDQVLVRKLANYDIDPKSLSVQGGHREQLLKQAAQFDPKFDQKNYNTISAAINRFATGPQGNTVRSLNVAIEHMDTARRLGEALKNTDIPLFNQVANEFATQTGKPAPTSFNAVKEIVADEVIKGVIGGAGALQDREAAAKKVRDASSPAQLNAVFDSWTELLGGQLKGLERQYEGATSRKDFKERYLTGRALDALGGGKAAPAAGGEDWVRRAMDANPTMTLTDVITEGKRLKKLPDNYGVR